MVGDKQIFKANQLQSSGAMTEKALLPIQRVRDIKRMIIVATTWKWQRREEESSRKFYM